jgi:hypothetical protein
VHKTWMERTYQLRLQCKVTLATAGKARTVRHPGFAACQEVYSKSEVIGDVEVSAAQSTLSTSTPLALIYRNQSLCISVHLPTSHFGIAVALTTMGTLPKWRRNSKGDHIYEVEGLRNPACGARIHRFSVTDVYSCAMTLWTTKRTGARYARKRRAGSQDCFCARTARMPLVASCPARRMKQTTIKIAKYNSHKRNCL